MVLSGPSPLACPSALWVAKGLTERPRSLSAALECSPTVFLALPLGRRAAEVGKPTSSASQPLQCPLQPHSAGRLCPWHGRTIATLGTPEPSSPHFTPSLETAGDVILLQGVVPSSACSSWAPSSHLCPRPQGCSAPAFASGTSSLDERPLEFSSCFLLSWATPVPPWGWGGAGRGRPHFFSAFGRTGSRTLECGLDRALAPESRLLRPPLNCTFWCGPQPSPPQCQRGGHEAGVVSLTSPWPVTESWRHLLDAPIRDPDGKMS